MMPTESEEEFFIICIRVLKASATESFSVAGEGHRKRGRFLVELPCIHKNITSIFQIACCWVIQFGTV
jgi:hypothetical protein